MIGIETILQLLAPWSCLVCGDEGEFVCASCYDAVPAASASPLDGTRLDSAWLGRARFKGAWAASDYRGLSKDLVYKLKFERAAGLAWTLAKIMDERLPSFASDTLVVPLPTANKRVRQRGYDQAVLLARAFAKQRSLTFVQMLARQGHQRQVGANREQRHAQLARAWRIKKPALMRGASILLVDDVLTTGATIESAANLCMQHGARSVRAITFAQKL
jgi:ComF family protein